MKHKITEFHRSSDSRSFRGLFSLSPGQLARVLFLVFLVAGIAQGGTSQGGIAQGGVAHAAGSQPAQEETENLGSGGDAGKAPVALGELNVDLSQIRRVKVAGKLIEEAPMRVGNLDVLAPIVGANSRILSGLGAVVSSVAVKDIPGNPNTPTDGQLIQINLPSGAPIILTIGKATATIDGAEQILRAAPLTMNGKIWLPLYSLAPLLGASVRLQPDGTLHVNPSVQSVELFETRGYTVLTVKLSAPLKDGGVLMGTMDDPAVLYLDFPGYSMGFDALYTTTERIVNNGLKNVTKVRAAAFQSFPDTTRVALDLKREMTGVVQPLPDKTIFALLIVPPGSKPEIMVEPTSVVEQPRGDLRGLTIVVDAGHGGHDSGAPGGQSLEKTHTLDIARRLRNNLKARGANVLMTRDTDNFISLQGRVNFANSRGADLFFSVHIDSFKSTSAGTTTHFWTAQSTALAREVQSEMAKATGLKNRGTKQSRFFVVRNTTMPSILAEVCFITNPREEGLLLKPQWREGVARGMAQGVSNYVSRYGVRGSSQ